MAGGLVGDLGLCAMRNVSFCVAAPDSNLQVIKHVLLTNCLIFLCHTLAYLYSVNQLHI